jgi:hypothetical protein
MLLPATQLTLVLPGNPEISRWRGSYRLMATLFDKVVSEAGLATLLAEGVVLRACRRAGIADPQNLKKPELQRLLPHLKVSLETYLARPRVTERLLVLENLTRSSSSGYNRIALDDPSLEED